MGVINWFRELKTVRRDAKIGEGDASSAAIARGATRWRRGPRGIGCLVFVVDVRAVCSGCWGEST
eukprot:3575291-Pleurochrysis_carterae.AAC.1